MNSSISRLISIIAIAVLCTASLWPDPLWAKVTSKRIKAMQEEGEAPIPAVMPGPTIRVLIAHQIQEALLDVGGRYLLTDLTTGKKLQSSFFGQRSVLTAGKKGIVWGDYQTGVTQLKLTPRLGERFFSIDGVQYKGVLYIHQIGNTLSLVNELPIEEYVAAVVQGQTSPQTPIEASRALAICVRSDASYTLHSKPNAYWQVYGPDVGYAGVGEVTANSRGGLAAESTHDLYLLYGGSPLVQENLFITKWTAHSAGMTVNYNLIDPDHAGRGDFSVTSPAAFLDRERTKWQAVVTKQELEEGFGLPKGSLKKVELVRDDKSHKVVAMQLVTDQESHTISYIRVRQVLGPYKIKSSDFSLTSLPRECYELVGYGEGPGTGLCLYSAEKMASQGDRAPAILNFFFPGAKIEIVKSAFEG